MRTLPPWESALDAAADLLAARLSGVDGAADLSEVLVLLPTMHVAAALRRRVLARAGRSAMLGPDCVSMATLADAGSAGDRAWRHRARLLMYGQLRERGGLVAGGDPWQLVEAVVDLFEALENAGRALPAGAELEGLLRDGYGLPDTGQAPLRREARLVEMLWTFWRESAGDAALTGTRRACQVIESAVEGGAVLVIGDDLPTPVIAAIGRARDAGADIDLLWTGRMPPQAVAAVMTPTPAPVADGIDALFDASIMLEDPDLRATATALRAHMPERPGPGAFTVIGADSREHEARIAEIAIRQARDDLGEAARIAFVTEDRRLARRVRALLARSGVEPDDPGGWALSTTSAAAAVERWLEAVEDDLRHGPLLDFLKSPFCGLSADRAAHFHDVWLFERYIVRMEGVASGADRYRNAIAARAERSGSEVVRERRAALAGLIDGVVEAAEPVLPFTARRSFHPGTALAALGESLERAGARSALAADAAGVRILEELDGLATAANAVPDARLDWRGFRTWLGRTLELATFRARGTGNIHFRNLASVADERFDAIVFGGLDASQFPGHPRRHPFFNDSVRRELGLTDWDTERERIGWRFRRALSAAPRRTLTWCRERDGEPQVPGAWLESLATLYGLTWGAPPDTTELAALARDPRTQVALDDGTPMPVPPTRPAPAGVVTPASWSVSAHQQLIDCPYRFFAAQCLGLDAPEDLAEEMSAQEFGTLVHRCLERFRSRHAVVPERAAAIAALVAITDEVFAARVAGSFEDEGYVHAWRRSIPAFIDWELERAADGAEIVEVERRFSGDDALDIGDGIRLGGKVDRTERIPGGIAVVDYKTGSALPSKREIGSGEDVQGASYALLQDAGEPVSLEYLRVILAPGEERPHHSRVHGAEVAPLVARVRERLHTLAAAVRGGAPLPANGAVATCRYCEYSGLCRRDAWYSEAGDD